MLTKQVQFIPSIAPKQIIESNQHPGTASCFLTSRQIAGQQDRAIFKF